MNFVKKLLGRGYFALLMMVLFAVPALAYLDPGTMTYVISMVAGLFIAGGAALAIFRRKIKLFFQNLGKKNTGSTASAPADDLGTEFDPMADVGPMAEDK